MSINHIPIRVMGPGSQPEEQQKLSYISMPNDMSTYTAPFLEEVDEIAGLPGAMEAINWLRQSLADYRPGDPPMLANLSELDADSRELINQVLGEGEVSITLDGDLVAKTQESVLAGVWRTMYLDGDQIVADLLEVGELPHVFAHAIKDPKAIDMAEPDDPAEILNALPILSELKARVATYNDIGEAHSINLSLLPLSDPELEFLDERLGRGPVDVLSRAYGKCQIISTATPNIWWVRYYNSMGTLILNSLEIVGVPIVVMAAEEDLADSAERLEQILAPYLPDVA
ncbi:MAG: hydrogenase expression/formation protein [Woeseiaceae bacterium]|nr:hydrogenase expression/formation protein [Woeseiaceae bacterium]